MGFSLTSWIIMVCDSWQWIVTNFSSLSWLEVCQVTSNPQSRTSRMLKVFGPIKTNLWDRSHKKKIYGTGPSLWGTGQTFMGLVRQKSVHISNNQNVKSMLKCQNKDKSKFSYTDMLMRKHNHNIHKSSKWITHMYIEDSHCSYYALCALVFNLMQSVSSFPSPWWIYAVK